MTSDSPTAAEEGPSTDIDKTLSPVVTTTSGKQKRPPYKYDPDKVTLRFIFANRDGLAVTLQCQPSDTIGEVKGALLSVWPDELPHCSGGDNLRLVCMGKGILMPDTRSLEDCQVPVFKTHPTPVNVSVRPENNASDADRKSGRGGGGGARNNDGRRSNNSSSNNNNNNNSDSNNATSNTATQGCACTIL